MTHSFPTVHDLLESGAAFDYVAHDLTTRVEPVGNDEWSVRESGERIGLLARKRVDRATYYIGYIEDEPGVVNWVSDDIGVLISRMLTLR